MQILVLFSRFYVFGEPFESICGDAPASTLHMSAFARFSDQVQETVLGGLKPHTQRLL